MTKELMKQWFSNVFFPSAPADSLLLVDSWGCWKDEAAIEECTPRGKKATVRYIPPKTTDRIQPLDVYFFRMWKNFVRVFSDRVLVDSLSVLLYQRDNILKLQSLVHNQFSAERFAEFIRYSWFAAGYHTGRGATFTTPNAYCFPDDLPDACRMRGCQDGSFIRCAHCKLTLCFAHFFDEFHYH
jgi:Tc5 transposase C-terminal domain/DDE superfamily endonuclease